MEISNTLPNLKSLPFIDLRQSRTIKMRAIKGAIIHHSLLLLNVTCLVIFLVCMLDTRKISSKFSFVSSKDQYEPIPSVELHKNWIVVTSILHPTEDVAKLAVIQGWRLLVVGDVKTPSNWSHPGVEYIGVDKQLTLPYRTTDSIPYNSYTRKNIGYLYAIHHGAEFIYDTDDDNYPTNDKIEFHLKPFTTGLLYKDKRYNIMNPYSHFGQPTIWPRGYPLESINAPTNNTYTLCSLKTPTIQQGLVSHDPDVDAIFRLTRYGTSTQFGINFDSRAPPLVLPEGIFAPFNSQNTLFTYEALWALVLPTSVTFRVTDIWRGYWAQRLMWLLGHKLAFFPPNAIQVRNPHSFLKDLEAEADVYTKSALLIEFLSNWQCAQNVSFFLCASQLTKDMAKAKFWTEVDADLVDTWLTDLRNIGYREPAMASNVDCDNSGDKDARRVYFSPVLQRDKQLDTKSPQRLIRTENLVNFCGDLLNETISKTRQVSKYTHENMLLIVVFNNPFPRIIPLLENLYYEHFPNMVYCGGMTSYEDLMSQIRSVGEMDWIERPISFIKIKSKHGYLGYECAIRALEMNYAVDGYFVVGDDVLFNFWNLWKVDLNIAAYENKPQYMSRHTQTNDSAWVWWGSDMGYNATNLALEEVQFTSAKDPSRLLVKEFLHNLQVKKLKDKIAVDTSDLYYLPSAKRELFLHIAKVFLKHKVFLEIAVPTIISGLYPSPIGSLRGQKVWGTNRQKWKRFYNPKDIYLHPAKLSKVLYNKNAKMSYCQFFVKSFLRKLNEKQ